MLNVAKNIVAQQLVEVFAALDVKGDKDRILSMIEGCSLPEEGQVSFKTFSFAKDFRKNPVEVATLITEKLQSNPLIAAVSCKSGFVNIFVKSGALVTATLNTLDPQYAAVLPLPQKNAKVLVEHSQPNTHKELHVGHTRNTILGDTLCNLYKHCGYDAIAQNYHGDEGVHVAKCLWYMQKEGLKPTNADDKGTWLGSVYAAATKTLNALPEDAAATIYKQEISVVLEQLEAKSGPFYDLWVETRKWSFDLFKQMYGWLCVDFDAWISESDVSEESFEIVQKYYDKKVFTKSEGAIGADLSAEDLGFFILRKSDGRGLYSTKDIALAFRREKEYQPDQVIYVVDDRQSYHFKQVFATLRHMGLSFAQKCYHLAYNVVETKEGAMSSRHGTIVPMLGLIEKMEKLCLDNILVRQGSTEANAADREKARKIAVSGIRYGMIKIDPASKIIFDMDSWLKVEGNTGPYLLYCYTRMVSLLKKNEAAGAINLTEQNWDLLNRNEEHAFIYQLAKFNEKVLEATTKMKPNIFANYTYDLCKSFNAFYEHCPIKAEDDAAIKRARLALTKLGVTHVQTALKILGMPSVSSM